MEKAATPLPAGPPAPYLDPALGIFHFHQVLWSFGHSEALGVPRQDLPGHV